MNLLKEHFDIAVETPDGVSKLRRLILNMAVHGRLVEQDPADQPVTVLLDLIQQERARLVGGRITALSVRQSGSENPAVSNLPRSWQQLPLPHCFYLVGSKVNQVQTKDYHESGKIPIIDQGKSFVVGYSDAESRVLHIPHAVVIFGDHTKNLKFVDFDFIIGADGVKVLCPFKAIFPRFFYFVLQSYELRDRGYARHFNVLIENSFPLAPYPEQKRIVAKIDQLMSLCDRLEAERNERDKKRLSMHAAAMNRLLTAPDKPGFNKSWNFITKHFDELYSVNENVAELKKAILQLAVMGKLVPQDPNDQPASELLKEIEAEKKRLVEEGKIRAQKLLPPTKEEEIPYLMPKGWEWVRLGEISRKVHYGYTASADPMGKGVRLLRISDIQGNDVSWESVPGCQIADEDVDQYKLEDNDVLIARTGGTIGKSYLVQNVSLTAVFASYLIRIVPSKKIDARYLKTFIESPPYWKQLYAKSMGTGQPNVNGTSLSNLLVPLAPLNEQRRIVSKVADLTTACDELEKHLNASSDKRAAILNAVLARV